MCKICIENIDLTYYPTIIIGIFHLILLTFRTFEIAIDIYSLEEIIEFYEITCTLLIILLQFIIIVSLFVGIIKKQYFFLLPWLCFTGPVFCMATVYGILYMVTGDNNVQSFLNFICIGGFWFSWYIVLKNYLSLKNCSKMMMSYKGYKYSANFKDIDNECGECFL